MNFTRLALYLLAGVALASLLSQEKGRKAAAQLSGAAMLMPRKWKKISKKAGKESNELLEAIRDNLQHLGTDAISRITSIIHEAGDAAKKAKKQTKKRFLGFSMF
jgi:phosphoribosyl-ATP pyrophosphohydrolase